MGKWIWKQKMNQNKFKIFINENFEIFKIEFFRENSEYLMNNFWTDYQHRPNFFWYFSPYEFSHKTNKINNIHNHWFHEDRPQYKTHNIYGYKIPRIPIFQIYKIPLEKKYPKKYPWTIIYIFFFMANFVQC
jgi:hypothetical protein